MVVNLQSYLIVFTIFNLLYSSNANYVGKADFQKIIENQIIFKCEYTGKDGDGQFSEWYKGNEPINSDQTDHYTIEKTEKMTKLNITYRGDDQQVSEWSVRTNKPNQERPTKCVFGRIRPSPQSMKTNRETEKLNSNHASVRREENEPVTFKCVLAPSPARVQQITWKFSKDGENFGQLPSGVRNIGIYDIVIDRVNKTHQGYYRCQLNRVSFTAILRVKNRLAALWPFIGIVCTVIVLVIGIFILEKRQKAAKNNAVVEEEVNNPLIQSANKSSDKENPNSPVNA